MDKSKLPVITISRQYGAGGTTVAKALSERLSIPWYDRNLVKIVAEKSGYSEEEVKKDSEELSNSSKFMDFILNSASSYVSPHDALFKAQKEAILEIAKEPCIIIGHCSNIFLRLAGFNTFDVFLFADMEHRVERAETLKDEVVKNFRKYVEHRDNLRQTYYKQYTGSEMGRFSDYHLLLDTGKIGYTTAADIIYEAVTKTI
ncbi:MAG: cytidylate kinase-like family protein [Lachnospiraceae bacterium]|nr:cytidylate kinase-like family protein [Lachnospiraceae bacterium]